MNSSEVCTKARSNEISCIVTVPCPKKETSVQGLLRLTPFTSNLLQPTSHHFKCESPQTSTT